MCNARVQGPREHYTTALQGAPLENKVLPCMTNSHLSKDRPD